MSKENSRSLRILILDAGEAPYPLTVARSLGFAGHHVDLGFSYGSYIFNSFSKYCSKIIFYPDPSYALEDFLNLFEKLAGKYDFIIPPMEKTMLPLSKIKDDLEKKGTSVPVPSHDILNLAVNKAKVLEVCFKNNIQIPKTLVLCDLPDVGDVVKELGVPFIMKISTEINVKPGPGSRFFVFRNKPSQKHFQAAFESLRKHGSVILQEWIEGSGIGASFIFSRSHELIAYFGHRRILERFPEGGPSVIAETYLHPNALEGGLKLLKALKWQGVAMTEFRLGSDGKLYFMELNPRFWGTLPLTIASGLDFPRLLVEYYNSRRKNGFSHVTLKKKIFVKAMVLPYLFLESIKTKNLTFSKKLIKESSKIFKFGVPFIEELEKFDLAVLIKQLPHIIRRRFSKKSPSRIGKIFFGPAMAYEKLAKVGIRSIVDLREEKEKSTIKVPSRIEYYNFPIKDDSALDPDSLLNLVNTVKKLSEKGYTYIHCRLGRGRAPMVVIAYLISEKVPLEKAYLTVYNARPYSYLNLAQRRAIYEFYKKYSRIKK